MIEKKRVSGIIQTYSKKAREQITKIGWTFLEEAGITELADDIFSCVDEIIKNAVKANYKFLLIFKKIKENIARDNPGISSEEIINSSRTILRNREKYDKAVSRILDEENISSRVREILNEESKHLSIKNKVFEENRDYNDDEKKIISGLTNLKDIRKEMKENDIKILLKIESDGDFIYIEITNTAPIITSDLKRIHEKRDEYKKYKDAGKEYEFFINNIDTSESGFGLGYAKIDSHLASLGLDVQSAITIISANNTTAMLSLPLGTLKKRATQ